MEALKLDNYTYEDYLEIDKSTKDRVELIFGKIYMMAGASAKHQDVVGNIFYFFRSKQQECKPRVAPYDLHLTCEAFGKDARNVVQPDVMLFCDEELPCAIFEVLSPSTAVKDKGEKLRLYECAGIKEYFIVEPEYKVVEKFQLENGRYSFIGNFLPGEEMEVECARVKMKIDDIFEGIE